MLTKQAFFAIVIIKGQGLSVVRYESEDRRLAIQHFKTTFEKSPFLVLNKFQALDTLPQLLKTERVLDLVQKNTKKGTAHENGGYIPR